MKKYSIVLILMFFVCESFAQISVEHEWSFERKTWIRYDYKSGGFLGIGAQRKVFDKTYVWKAPLKFKMESEGREVVLTGTVGSSADAKAFRISQSCRYPDDLKNLDCLFLENSPVSLAQLQMIENMKPFGRTNFTRTISTNRMSEITTDIQSNKISINVKDYLYSDRKGVRQMKFHSDKIFGGVKINLPLDNKFISFQRKNKMSGIFNPFISEKSLVRYVGSNFKSQTDLNTLGKWETVWTLPGRNNYIEFRIGDISTEGLGLGVANDQWVDIGAYEVEVASMDEILDQHNSDFLNTFKSINNSKLKDIDQSLKDLLKTNEISSEKLIDYRNALLTLVSSDEFKKEVFANYSLSEVSELLKTLNTIGLRNYLEPKEDSSYSYLGWDIKTATFILAIDIAKDSISKLDPFCEKMDYTTSDGEIKKISGINIASFYLSRAAARLTHFKFNEFSYLFQYMNELQESGLTFAQVRSDSDKMQRIRDVIDVLKDSNILKKSPFGVAHEELNDIYKNFGNINGNGQNLSDVLTLLKSVESEVESLRKEIMLRLRTFQPENNKVVDFKDLEMRVFEVSEDLSNLSKNIDGVFGINSKTFEPNGSNEDVRKQFVLFLVDVLTNYLSVFDEASGNISIDAFLKEYKDFYKIDDMKKRFYSCLPI